MIWGCALWASLTNPPKHPIPSPIGPAIIVIIAPKKKFGRIKGAIYLAQLNGGKPPDGLAQKEQLSGSSLTTNRVIMQLSRDQQTAIENLRKTANSEIFRLVPKQAGVPLFACF